MHVWSLAQCLLAQGHHCVVVTHAYGERVGVRVMSNGLRVYYLPFPAFAQENALPALYVSLPLMREVFVRERIEIVHGHQATSSLMHEAMMHAKVLGFRTVFTDHSLFGFAHLNKVLKFTLSNVDMCIGVSNACRANLVLRASLHPSQVTTIPNAVEAQMFTPDAKLRDPPQPRVNIIVLSRLAYRKGIDLVCRVIPLACAKFPHLHFIVGGGGPKRIILDEMIERHDLHDRVELLGEIPHEGVRNVLCRGQVFLNCSLTEAFCIAILEAACCGLVVVSTDVGGIAEVLDADMICFPDPQAASIVHGLVDALGVALERAKKLDSNPWEFHDRLSKRYSWQNVAKETVSKVYDPIRLLGRTELVDALDRYRGLGPLAGLLAVWVVALDALLVLVLQWVRPDELILKSALPSCCYDDDDDDGENIPSTTSMSNASPRGSTVPDSL
jgi:phosphatidylinositol glycan class A protein